MNAENAINAKIAKISSAVGGIFLVAVAVLQNFARTRKAVAMTVRGRSTAATATTAPATTIILVAF